MRTKATRMRRAPRVKVFPVTFFAYEDRRAEYGGHAAGRGGTYKGDSMLMTLIKISKFQSPK